jgi:predicted enzyme related to lactoylglutathione lyase
VLVIPVSDVDRAKKFYLNLEWRLDADFSFDNGVRIVQLTPHGSECSVQFGTNITSAVPGSAQGSYLIVSDIAATRNELIAHGVDVSDVFHAEIPGAQFQPMVLAVASAGQHRVTPATVLLPRSVIQMATAGCFRRSLPAFLDIQPSAMSK